MTQTRLFLVAPDQISRDLLVTCAAAATAAGDCASILVPAHITAPDVIKLQALHLAVIIRDCEPGMVRNLKADGIQISRSAPVKQLRSTLATENIGVFAATSRHVAMEAAESGADYIAFSQNSQNAGEPLLSWWRDIFEIPAVAFDPVDANELATLLTQNPDFIRPSDEMWRSAESASAVIRAISSVLRT
jgi:thiamine-phosphate pyrophosphorylase